MTPGLTRLVNVASGALGVVALAAVGWYTYEAFNSGLSVSSLRLNWLIAAFATHVLIIAALPVIWIRVLAMVRSETDGEARTTDFNLYHAYARSWLARYIPGRVWMFGGRIIYGRRAGISARSISASSALEAGISYSAIGLLGAAFLVGSWVHWSLAVVLATGGFACTWVLLKAAFASTSSSSGNSGQSGLISTLRKSSAWVTGGATPSYRSMTTVMVVYWMHAAVQLLFFIFVALAVDDYSSTDFMLLAGAWGVGATAGYLSVFSAGGLGVRDGVALAFVGPALTGPVAGTIVAVSRIILVVADLCLVGAVELAHVVLQRSSGRGVSKATVATPVTGVESR